MTGESEKHKGKIRQAIDRLGDKTIHSDKLVYTFLRSVFSSQCASWLDLGLGFVLFAWLGFTAAFATAIGAICGGVLNCFLNYRFTFHAGSVDFRAVAVKYAMIWTGSILLNSFGTEGFYHLLCDWSWLEEIGFKKDGYYAAARVFVSIVVSWFWNFPLQRYFVYVTTKFDSKAIAIFNFFRFKKKVDRA